MAARLRFCLRGEVDFRKPQSVAQRPARTITKFTAVSIAQSIRNHIPFLSEITTLIASGVGVRKATLVERLKANLPDRLLLSLSDEFGIPAQYEEAIKFAALALAAQNRLANNIPAASGARALSFSASLWLPLRFACGSD